MSIYEYDEQRQRRFDREEGYEDGLKRGEERLSSLLEHLMEIGDTESLRKVVTDKVYREELYKRYGL